MALAGGSVSWGYVAGLVGSRDLLRFLRPRPSAEFLLRAEAVCKPAALPRRRARSPVGASRPSRADGGRGGHFVPTDSPEPGGAAGRGCGAAGAAPRRHGRRHRRGFLDEAVRKISRSASRAAFPPRTRFPAAAAPERPGEELTVVSSTNSLGLPAVSARAAPPNGEEDVRPAFQAAPDRGLGSGQDLRPFSFFG